MRASVVVVVVVVVGVGVGPSPPTKIFNNRLTPSSQFDPAVRPAQPGNHKPAKAQIRPSRPEMGRIIHYTMTYYRVLRTTNILE